MNVNEKLSMGEIIRQLRINAGFTQEELGNHLGVQKSAVRKWEKGEVENIKRPTIQAMAELFNVSPPYLMGYDQTEKYNTTADAIASLIYMIYGVDMDIPASEWGIEEREKAKFTDFSITKEVCRSLHEAVTSLFDKSLSYYQQNFDSDLASDVTLNVEILKDDESILLNLYRELNDTDKSEIRGELRGILKKYPPK